MSPIRVPRQSARLYAVLPRVQANASSGTAVRRPLDWGSAAT
jgi:hypothetical protein